VNIDNPLWFTILR